MDQTASQYNSHEQRLAVEVVLHKKTATHCIFYKPGGHHPRPIEEIVAAGSEHAGTGGRADGERERRGCPVDHAACHQ